MNCIKCGKECKGKHIFCDECRNGMREYPVKPGTPIYLPARSALAQERKRDPKKKRATKAEDMISRLRSANRWLIAALVVCLFAFLMVSAALIYLLDSWGMPVF